MSNIIHKVKDALTDHGDKHHDSTKSSNHGPHDSNIANTADPRIDSDRSNLNTHSTATTGHSSTQPLATGAGANTYESARSSNHGPHDSNVANKVDPRVDSDRDNRAAYGTTSTGLGSHGTSTGVGSTGLGSHNTSTGVDSTGLGSHNTSTGVGSTGLATGTGAGAYESARSSNHGPHDSNVANKVDPRVDSDRDNRAAYGTTSTGLGSHSTSTGVGSTGLGSHNTSTGVGSGLATGTGANAYESTRSSNHGPHGSNIANAADPRVDSDRSNLGTHGSHHQSTGHSTGLGVGTGAAAGAAAGAYGHHESNRSSNHGPHDSNIANKVDPRVDSDRDNSAAYGTTSSGLGSHSTSTGLATGTGATGTTGLSGHHGTIGDRSQHATHSTATGPASSTAGPHENNLANKADPRVDSDLSKEHSGRFDKDVHKGSIGGAGVIPISGNAGPTSTKTFEEAQHTGAAGAGSSYNTPGSGLEHKKTAGPHKSDLANKLDPRVDSDLDGSKTVGGSQRI